MGVSYEVDPQSNLGWFREQLVGLVRRIETLEGASRSTNGRSGTVTGTLTNSSTTTIAGQSLVRRGGLVVASWRVTLTASVSAGNRLVQLPAGFLPDPAMPDVYFTAYTPAGAAVPMYLRTSDGAAVVLSGSASSGTQVGGAIPPFLAKS